MRQNVDGVTYDTHAMTPLKLWHNFCPPDHPQYQRYIVYRHSLHCYVAWIKTGVRRGGLNQLVVLDRLGLEALYRATILKDRRRSLARVLPQLPTRSA